MLARPVLVAVLAIACHGAMAQTQTVPPALTVQRLAPQLVAFAGSDANFQSLVNGLAGGTQVLLVSVLPTGLTQSVTFTPAAALAPVAVAQILEAARQQLIGLGIGSPTAEQIGFALMGGLVPTALGGTQVSGLLNPNPPSPAAQIQGQAGAGATAATPAVTNSVNVQTTAGTTTATATAPRSTSDSLIAPGATSRSAVPLPSASPTVNTSASPFATTPAPAPGLGSTPPAAERVPAGARPSRN